MITNAVKTTKLVDGNQDDFEGFVENLAKVVSKKKNVKKKKGFEMQEYNSKLYRNRKFLLYVKAQYIPIQ